MHESQETKNPWGGREVEPTPGVAEPPFTEPSFTQALLARDPSPSAPRELHVLVLGLSLATIYGIGSALANLGSVDGVETALSLVTRAGGMPLALLAGAALGGGSLYVYLAFFDAPIAPMALAQATARGVAATGLVLAGLTPALMLYLATSASPELRETLFRIGFYFAGALGLLRFFSEIRASIFHAGSSLRLSTLSGLAGFAVFSVFLGARMVGWLLAVGGQP